MGVLLTVLLSACGGGGWSPAEPTAPTPAADVAIVVDPSRTRQTIEDVGGGNFIHTFAQADDTSVTLSSRGTPSARSRGIRRRVRRAVADSSSHGRTELLGMTRRTAATDDGV